ncbi:MAG: hypothetical protein M0P69_08700 [Bacteroidales bacterium]|nr:hypothetical protein [Bacteroidales bacterium]
MIPHNIDAEAAILGIAMFNRMSLPQLTGLTEDDFADSKNKLIWGAITKIMQEGAMPDPVLVKEHLGDKVNLSDLLILVEQACIEPSIPYYVNIIKTKERGRRLYFATRMAQAALNDGADYEDIETALLSAISKRTASEGTTSLSDSGSVEEITRGDGLQAWATLGVTDLDTATGGIRGGEVCILAARTSVGKSACAVASTLHSAEMGWHPLYMTYEMAKKKLWQRMMSYQARVSLRKFRDGDYNDFDMRSLRQAEKELSGYLKRIRVNIEANTPGKLMQLIRMEQMSGNADYIILDHAGRMHADGNNRGKYEDSTEIIHRIKDMAIQLNVPVLVLWQLSRKTESKADKKPSLDDLRDTGHVEEVADTVILMYRDNYYDKNIPMEQAVCTMDVAKARDGGQLGEIQVPWKRLISRVKIVPASEMGTEIESSDEAFNF